MIKNVLRVTTAFLALLLTNQAMAEESSSGPDMSDTKETGSSLFTEAEWAIGIFCSSAEPGPFMLPYLTMNYKWLTAGVGVSVDHGRHYIDLNGDSQKASNQYNYSWHFGLRIPMSPKFSFTTGGEFWYSTVNGKNEQGEDLEEGYTVGPYLGFDYYFTKKLMTSLTLCPYAYAKYPWGAKVDEYFQNGRLGISYIF